MRSVLQGIFDKSFQLFLLEERENIASQVNERNLCGRLAPILEAAARASGFDGYYADVEYNRKQNGRVKTILDDRGVVVPINCDLILHSRGKYVEHDNLIAIEMKKSGRRIAERNSDRDRLRAMTKASYDGVWSADGVAHPEHVCGYKLGVLVELSCARLTFRTERFAEGNSIGDKIGRF